MIYDNVAGDKIPKEETYNNNTHTWISYQTKVVKCVMRRINSDYYSMDNAPMSYLNTNSLQ